MSDIASPCINVCRMHPVSGVCEGCFRTLAEIAGWGSSSDEDKRRILAWVERRRETAVDPWNGALRGDCE